MAWHVAVQNLEAAQRQKDSLEGSRVTFRERLGNLIGFCREDVADWCACSGEANMVKWGRRFYILSLFSLIAGSGLAYPGFLLHLRTDTKGGWYYGVKVLMIGIGLSLLILSCCSMFFCTCHLNPILVSKRRRFQGSYL